MLVADLPLVIYCSTDRQGWKVLRIEVAATIFLNLHPEQDFLISFKFLQIHHRSRGRTPHSLKVYVTVQE